MKNNKSNVMMSLMSNVVRFLVAIRFIPVKNVGEERTKSFKLCSPVTLSFFIVYYGILVCLIVLNYIFAREPQYKMVEFIITGDATVAASGFSSSTVLASAPFF